MKGYPPPAPPHHLNTTPPPPLPPEPPGCGTMADIYPSSLCLKERSVPKPRICRCRKLAAQTIIPPPHGCSVAAGSGWGWRGEPVEERDGGVCVSAGFLSLKPKPLASPVALSARRHCCHLSAWSSIRRHPPPSGSGPAPPLPPGGCCWLRRVGGDSTRSVIGSTEWRWKVSLSWKNCRCCP